MATSMRNAVRDATKLTTRLVELLDKDHVFFVLSLYLIQFASCVRGGSGITDHRVKWFVDAVWL